MQLREEIRTNGYTQECPVNDWLCNFFDNGSCKLSNAQEKCAALKNVKRVKKILE